MSDTDHLCGEVCNARLADFTAREKSISDASGIPEYWLDPLRGFPEEGMEEVCATEGSSDDRWDPTV